MRFFFGLDLTQQQKISLSEWRDQAFGQCSHTVPARNFHLTLAFLGETSEAKLETLLTNAEKIEQHSFSQLFNKVGFWRKPKAAFLACDAINPSIIELQKQVREAIAASQLPVEHRDFVPHITLFRGSKSPPPAPIIAPNFEFKFEQICLFQSVRSQHGIHYQVVEQWNLAPNFSHKC